MRGTMRLFLPLLTGHGATVQAASGRWQLGIVDEGHVQANVLADLLLNLAPTRFHTEVGASIVPAMGLGSTRTTSDMLTSKHEQRQHRRTTPAMAGGEENDDLITAALKDMPEEMLDDSVDAAMKDIPKEAYDPGIHGFVQTPHYQTFRQERLKEYEEVQNELEADEAAYRIMDIPVAKGKALCNLWSMKLQQEKDAGFHFRSELWNNPKADALQKTLYKIGLFPAAGMKSMFKMAMSDRGGSAMALVTPGDGFVTISYNIVNPEQLFFGEFAEEYLLKQIAEQFSAKGMDVYLKDAAPQIEDDFYARCNFFKDDTSAGDLKYRAPR
jgi:hypothetical protein